MPSLDPEIVEKIRKMREAEVPWNVIEEEFSVSYHTARGSIDPAYLEERRIKQNSYRHGKGTGRIRRTSRTEAKIDCVEAGRRWKDRADTRNLTGLLMGDPYPGRSALDKKQARS